MKAVSCSLHATYWPPVGHHLLPDMTRGLSTGRWRAPLLGQLPVSPDPHQPHTGLQAACMLRNHTTEAKKIHYHQCTGGGLKKGGCVQPDHGSGPPLPWFLLAERFDQRGRSSPPPLAFYARWDSNHGVSPWNHTPHCQLLAIPVRLTNYVGRAGLITEAITDPTQPP
jgi:hypothetical protein